MTAHTFVQIDPIPEMLWHVGGLLSIQQTSDKSSDDMGGERAGGSGRGGGGEQKRDVEISQKNVLKYAEIMKEVTGVFDNHCSHDQTVSVYRERK